MLNSRRNSCDHASFVWVKLASIDLKGTVSVLTPWFYVIGLKNRVDLLVRKPVLHFLNAAKQNKMFLNFVLLTKKHVGHFQNLVLCASKFFAAQYFRLKSYFPMST